MLNFEIVNKKDTIRAKILSSAMEAFSENGIQGVSIRIIAKKAELSIGSIYVYFKDKNQILEELHKSSMEALMKSVIPNPNLKIPLEILHESFELFISFASKNPEDFKLLFESSTNQNHSQETKLFSTEIWFNYLKNLVADCLKDGSIKHYNQEVVSLTIWSALLGYAHLSLDRNHTGFSDSQQKSIIRDSLYFLKDLLQRY